MISLSTTAATLAWQGQHLIRTSVVVLAILFCASDAWAQTPLEALFTNLAGDGPKRSSFYEIRRLSEIDLPLESRGELHYDPPATLRKITTEPIAEQLELNESSLSVTIGGTTRELPLDAVPAAGALAAALRGLLAGRLSDVQEHFSISLSPDTADWQMTLSPRNQAVSSVLQRIEVRGETRNIRQIEILQTNGDESVMQILATQ
ncbi:MAG: LolA-related protein [Burkholderiaceae bacterium]